MSHVSFVLLVVIFSVALRSGALLCSKFLRHVTTHYVFSV